MSSTNTATAEAALDRRLRRADALHRRAVQENARGHAARGEQLILRGLEILAVDPARHDPETHDAEQHGERCRTTSRLLATLAKSVVEIRGVEPALSIMATAVDWSQCLDDPELTAFLVSQRALILFRGGRLDAAESDFDTAVALMPGEGVDLVRVLLNRGALHVERGAVPPARRDLARARQLAHDLDFRQAERITLHNLGCLELTSGNLPEALQRMQDGMEMDGEVQQGIAHLDRSRVLLAAGLPDEADAALVQAAELFRRDRCWQDLGEVDLTRAEVALLTDRAADARRLAARARDRFRRHGNDRWRRAAELVLLHADQAAGRPPGRLIAPAQRLASELAEAGLSTQQRTATLLSAELELALGRLGEADDTLRQVGPARRSDPIALRLHTRLVRAASYEQHGDRASARRALASGLRDLATYQAQFGGIDLQSASAVHGRRLARRDLQLALQSGRPAAVLAAVERSRAVSGRIRPVTPPTDERAAALLAELRQAVDAGNRPRVVELQTELRSRSWLTSGSRAWQPPVAFGHLRTAAAQDDVHLVTITEVQGRLGAVIVPADAPPRLVELGDVETVREGQRRLSADLDVLANAGLAPPMVVAVTRSLRRTAAELGSLLAAAFPDDGRPVVVSPSSHLLALPWPLLPQLAGRPVTVTPSLSGWQLARSRAAEPTADGAAARSTGWGLTAAAGPGLVRAREETTGVVRAWDRTVVAQDLPGATPADLLAAMGGSRLVHVAAHGTHQAENPMFSSLALTGGPLFAYELDRRTRLAEHVVLSACDVGRSTERSGAETLGLTSVLLQLGTASVVAGVARVHDDVAADLMPRYHAELAAGRGSAEALSLVTARLDPPTPFVCFGTSWRA